MESEKEKLLREIAEMTFEEKLEYAEHSIKDWTDYPYLFTYADLDKRRERIYN